MICNVKFVGDYFSLTTTVEVSETTDTPKEDAIGVAARLLESFYGWDVESAANVDVTVEVLET